MEAFGGTLLLVSHDRYLIDRLATQIWEIREGRLHVFAGTYKEYVAFEERAARQSKEASAQATQAAKAAAPPTATAKPNADREARKRAELVVALEAQIAAAEAALSHCTTELQAAADAQRHADLGPLSSRYASQQAQLDRLLAEWETLAS